MESEVSKIDEVKKEGHTHITYAHDYNHNNDSWWGGVFALIIILFFVILLIYLAYRSRETVPCQYEWIYYLVMFSVLLLFFGGFGRCVEGHRK